ncbi:diaminopimelate epimerase [Lewinella marina]|uniref:Diaminopimelate epimerase n=1 Tax=Neolewinella marina TaxID=438751 RepID=A0A2G0CFN0_9BACT|nr:diaminopimelate epimerase [Neolewinella marina]NJB85589.1 diaminopimelate epimerase [Neolewinella marina]PHK98727.1 diaminopimelate epimerase [Neolewinella marina]
MDLTFYKYHGAGNDFILLDDRAGKLADRLSPTHVARLCDRHFGVGADGLMLLRPAPPEFDFEMVYFNADGSGSTLCGNGGRCIVRFAADLGIERDIYRFLASDGPHEATLTPAGDIALGMADVETIREVGADYEIDTGSPHYLRFVENLDTVDVVAEGRALRQSPPYRDKGINVNFVRQRPDGLDIATYERGVEDETLACGTGVTAAAIGSLMRRPNIPDGPFLVPVQARGGSLSVSGEKQNGRFTNLQLIGPATFVFTGTISL